MARYISWSVTVFIIVSSSSCFCQNSKDATNLRNSIMTGYRDTVLPGSDYNEVLNVDITFSLVGIRDYDPVASTLSITGFFSMEWYDNRISWDPEDYGDIKSIFFKQKEVWLPNLLSFHDNRDVKFIGHSETPVRYHSNGEASWRPANVFDFLCVADITFYPFDTQNCTVAFVPYQYLPEEVSFTISKPIDTQFYKEQPLWELMNTNLYVSVLTEPDVTLIYMTYVIKRRPSFFIVNIILPIATLCLLNVLVFVLPADSGERVGFSITILLAISVYLTIVSDTLPAVSSPSIALLCYMLLFHLITSVFIMTSTVIGLKFYFRSYGNKDNKIPRWMINITMRVYRCTCRKKTNVSPMENGGVLVVDLESMKEEAYNKPQRNVRDADNPVSWEEVGQAFDRLCIFFFLTFIGIGDAIFICIYYSKI